MGQAPTAERRKHQRYPLPASVNFFHAPSHRDFPGRCVDISAGGLLMYVPATVPIHPGQPVRMSVGSVPRPELTGLSDKPLDATVVRVDRHNLLDMGQLAVGVRFAIS